MDGLEPGDKGRSLLIAIWLANFLTSALCFVSVWADGM